jgi:hypothetical protein
MKLEWIFLGVCLVGLLMSSLVWLQNDHNKLLLAMQMNMHQQLQDVYCQTIAHVSWPSLTQINMYVTIYINIHVNPIHFAWPLLYWKPYLVVISPTTLGTSNYLPSKDHKILPNLLKLKCHKTLLLSTEH